jgi:hypothetical protein
MAGRGQKWSPDYNKPIALSIKVVEKKEAGATATSQEGNRP